MQSAAGVKVVFELQSAICASVAGVESSQAWYWPRVTSVLSMQ
jgi:hypothetical protein